MTSQEKRALRNAKAKAHSSACPHCGFDMLRPRRGLHLIKTPQSTLDASLDHILPRSAGGSDRPENLRVVCRLCNQSRAAAGHCVGVLACVRAVLGRKRPTVGEVSRTWLRWRAATSGAAPRSAGPRRGPDHPS